MCRVGVGVETCAQSPAIAKVCCLLWCKTRPTLTEQGGWSSGQTSPKAGCTHTCQLRHGQRLDHCRRAICTHCTGLLLNMPTIYHCHCMTGNVIPVRLVRTSYWLLPSSAPPGTCWRLGLVAAVSVEQCQVAIAKVSDGRRARPASLLEQEVESSARPDPQSAASLQNLPSRATPGFARLLTAVVRFDNSTAPASLGTPSTVTVNRDYRVIRVSRRRNIFFNRRRPCISGNGEGRIGCRRRRRISGDRQGLAAAGGKTRRILDRVGKVWSFGQTDPQSAGTRRPVSCATVKVSPTVTAVVPFDNSTAPSLGSAVTVTVNCDAA